MIAILQVKGKVRKTGERRPVPRGSGFIQSGLASEYAARVLIVERKLHFCYNKIDTQCTLKRYTSFFNLKIIFFKLLL